MLTRLGSVADRVLCAIVPRRAADACILNCRYVAEYYDGTRTCSLYRCVYPCENAVWFECR